MPKAQDLCGVKGIAIEAQETFSPVGLGFAVFGLTRTQVKITLIIDETGDPKKGKTTDYIARQYLGKLGKIEQGIVSVTAIFHRVAHTF